MDMMAARGLVTIPLFTPIICYAAMIGVKALTGAASWKCKSEPIGWFAAAGAFATPLMIASHDADRLALAGYLGMVDLAFLSFAFAMKWGKFPLLLMVGTLELFWGGIVQAPTIEPIGRAAIVLCYFHMFALGRRFAKIDESKNTRIVVTLTECINVASATLALKYVFPLDTQNVLATSFLVILASVQAALLPSQESRLRSSAYEIDMRLTNDGLLVYGVVGITDDYTWNRFDPCENSGVLYVSLFVNALFDFNSRDMLFSRT